jgi:hypothetical protein
MKRKRLLRNSKDASHLTATSLHPNHITLPLHPNHMENQTSHVVYLIATAALRDGGNFLAISAQNQ